MVTKRTDNFRGENASNYGDLLEKGGFFSVNETAAPAWQGESKIYEDAATIAATRAALETARSVASKLEEPYKTAALNAINNALVNGSLAAMQQAIAAVETAGSAAAITGNAAYEKIAQDGIEDAEREREARIKQLRMQIDSAYESFVQEGYTTKAEQQESKERFDELDKQRARIAELKGIKNPTDAEKQELASLAQAFPENVERVVETESAVMERVERQATADGRDDIAEQARETLDKLDSLQTAMLDNNRKPAPELEQSAPSTSQQNSAAIQYDHSKDADISHAETLSPSIAITIQSGKDTKTEQLNPNKPTGGGISFG